MALVGADLQSPSAAEVLVTSCVERLVLLRELAPCLNGIYLWFSRLCKFGRRASSGADHQPRCSHKDTSSLLNAVYDMDLCLNELVCCSSPSRVHSQLYHFVLVNKS